MKLPRALTHALLEQLIRAVQVREVRIRCRDADNVAVGALEREAAHEGPGVLVREKAADGLEPGLAVGDVKRLPRVHLLDVRRRMHIVPIQKRQADALRQQLPDSGFTAARDSHDHHLPAHHSP